VNKNILTKSIFAALLLASSVVAAEEQYPAADFQPTVIYSDSADAGAKGEPTPAAASASSESTSTASEKGDEKSSSQTYLLGLAVLAIAGGFFLSQKPKCKGKKHQVAADAAVYSSDASGLTGVEKYLQEKNKTAPTGVAQYLAKKEAAEKEASVTGVERYLRSRG
jgi:hypothetical protein